MAHSVVLYIFERQRGAPKLRAARGKFFPSFLFLTGLHDPIICVELMFAYCVQYIGLGLLVFLSHV